MKQIYINHSCIWNQIKQISIMRCKHNSGSCCMNFLEKIHHHNHIFLVKITCWFVCKNSIRFMNKRSRNGDSLTLSTREMLRIFIFFMKHANFCQEFTSATSNGIFSVSTDLESIGYIFTNRLRRNQFIVLKNHTTRATIRSQIS